MQDSLSSRRRFLGWGNGLLTAAGLASRPLPAATSRQTAEGIDYYDKLGVAKIVNAAGTYTALTASTMPLSVQAAVARAAKHPVRLAELQTAAGEYLARQLRSEAALVTAGAASALTLGTAACMSVANRAAVHNIPTDVAGLKNEVIVQKSHRYDYDHAMRNCGIRFVEVETPEEYEAAFTGRTVMTHFFNAAEAERIGREDWIRVAHRHGVPCFNDAAADVPPIANLWNYTQVGFDLVTFSGGKGIRGPQNAGLLLGRKDLIAAAVQNNSPRSDTVGRGMKVAKEQIVGMVAAVDWFLSKPMPAWKPNSASAPNGLPRSSRASRPWSRILRFPTSRPTSFRTCCSAMTSIESRSLPSMWRRSCAAAIRASNCIPAPAGSPPPAC